MGEGRGIVVNVRFPRAMLAEIDAVARELGGSRSEAIRALMAPTLKRRATARTKRAA